MSVSMPSPRRSILTRPMTSTSSFSHWMTVRASMAAGSTGTVCAIGSSVRTKPPTWIERWRGRGEGGGGGGGAGRGGRGGGGGGVAGGGGEGGGGRRDGGLGESGGVGRRALLLLEMVAVERQRIGLFHRKAEHAGGVADRGFRAIGDLLAHHGGVLAAVALVHVLQHALAVAVGEVDVDVGRAFAVFAQEPLEEQA